MANTDETIKMAQAFQEMVKKQQELKPDSLVQFVTDMSKFLAESKEPLPPETMLTWMKAHLEADQQQHLKDIADKLWSSQNLI